MNDWDNRPTLAKSLRVMIKGLGTGPIANPFARNLFPFYPHLPGLPMSGASQVVGCPGCQSKMRVGSAGTYRCPKCGQSFQIGAPAAAKPAAAPKPQPAARPAAAAPPKPQRPTAPVSTPAASFSSAPLGTPSYAAAPYLQQPAATGATATKPAAAKTGNKSTKLILLAVGAVATLLLMVGVVTLAILQPWRSGDQVAAAPQAPAQQAAPQAAQPPAADPAANAPPAANQAQGGDEQDAQSRASGVRNSPYVGLDQVIWKPGDKMPPKQEGSGPRTPLVGHSMQANEVRTVEWKIVASYSVPGIDNKLAKVL